MWILWQSTSIIYKAIHIRGFEGQVVHGLLTFRWAGFAHVGYNEGDIKACETCLISNAIEKAQVSNNQPLS